MKIHVKVTQEHIDKGIECFISCKQFLPFDCPITLAIKDSGFIDAFINKRAGACVKEVLRKRLFRKNRTRLITYNFNTPLEAAKFIVKFDSPKYDKINDKFIYFGEPFEFDLELV